MHLLLVVGLFLSGVGLVLKMLPMIGRGQLTKKLQDLHGFIKVGIKVEVDLPVEEVILG
jgi:hypothetical protein